MEAVSAKESRALSSDVSRALSWNDFGGLSLNEFGALSANGSRSLSSHEFGILSAIESGAVSANESRAVSGKQSQEMSGDTYILFLNEQYELGRGLINFHVNQIVSINGMLKHLYDNSLIFQQAVENLNIGLIFKSCEEILRNIDEYCWAPKKCVDAFPNALDVHKPNMDPNFRIGLFLYEHKNNRKKLRDDLPFLLELAIKDKKCVKLILIEALFLYRDNIDKDKLEKDKKDKLEKDEKDRLEKDKKDKLARDKKDKLDRLIRDKLSGIKI
jgi:hypothetical protein